MLFADPLAVCRSVRARHASISDSRHSARKLRTILSFKLQGGGNWFLACVPGSGVGLRMRMNRRVAVLGVLRHGGGTKQRQGRAMMEVKRAFQIWTGARLKQ